MCIVSGLFVLPFNDITASLTAGDVPQFRSTEYPQYAVRCGAVRGERTPVLRQQARLCSTAFRAQSGSFVT